MTARIASKIAFVTACFAGATLTGYAMAIAG